MIADMLFIIGRKLNISLIFICGKPHSFLVNDTSLALDNLLSFIRILLERI